MSTQRKPSVREDGISEEAVEHYLRIHPDFFEHHADLLMTLRLPHQPGGSAVSLVERQVMTLRQQNHKLERKLKDLLDVARANEGLADKIHALATRLLAAVDVDTVLDTVETSLREDFGAQHSVLVLFEDPSAARKLKATRFVRIVDREDAALKTFSTFLASARPRCGQVRDTQRDFLFGEGTDEIGSVALVPLGKKATHGLLAVGSFDSDHFSPAMSTEFLRRIGELVAAALR